MTGDAVTTRLLVGLTLTDCATDAAGVADASGESDPSVKEVADGSALSVASSAVAVGSTLCDGVNDSCALAVKEPDGDLVTVLAELRDAAAETEAVGQNVIVADADCENEFNGESVALALSDGDDDDVIRATVAENLTVRLKEMTAVEDTLVVAEMSLVVDALPEADTATTVSEGDPDAEALPLGDMDDDSEPDTEPVDVTEGVEEIENVFLDVTVTRDEPVRAVDAVSVTVDVADSDLTPDLDGDTVPVGCRLDPVTDTDRLGVDDAETDPVNDTESQELPEDEAEPEPVEDTEAENVMTLDQVMFAVAVTVTVDVLDGARVAVEAPEAELVGELVDVAEGDVVSVLFADTVDERLAVGVTVPIDVDVFDATDDMEDDADAVTEFEDVTVDDSDTFDVADIENDGLAVLLDVGTLVAVLVAEVVVVCTTDTVPEIDHAPEIVAVVDSDAEGLLDGIVLGLAALDGRADALSTLAVCVVDIVADTLPLDDWDLSGLIVIETVTVTERVAVGVELRAALPVSTRERVAFTVGVADSDIFALVVPEGFSLLDATIETDGDDDGDIVDVVESDAAAELDTDFIIVEVTLIEADTDDEAGALADRE